MPFIPNMPPSMQQPMRLEEQKPVSNYIPRVMIDLKNLPSKSLSYPANSKIKYRPYSFGEVKQVSQTKSIPDEDKFEFVLKGVECSFDTDLLTISDLLYIGLLRKISTFGPTQASVTIPCQCGNKITYKIEVDKLEFDDIQAPSLPVIADLDNGSIEFMPLTIGDFKQLVSLGKLDDEIAMFAIQAKNLDFELAYQTIFNCSPFDKQTLDEVDRILYHGIAPINLVCSVCEQKHKVELDEEATLMMPFRFDEGAVRARIRFSP